jgi:fructose-1,6-bisphosphatase/sedoheptulose 1,7-bisphosphatase-like protein
VGRCALGVDLPLATRPGRACGVKFKDDMIETATVVMRSVTGTVRWIRAEHRQLDKFCLDW